VSTKSAAASSRSTRFLTSRCWATECVTLLKWFAIIREQSPAIERSQGYAITRVDYAGDEGGIVCKVDLGPDNEDRLYLRRLPICDFVKRYRSLVRSPRIRDVGSNACNVVAWAARDRQPDVAWNEKNDNDGILKSSRISDSDAFLRGDHPCL
jgi:hypothetical protein